MNNTMNRICEICGCAEEELFELEIDGEIKTVCRDCAERAGFVECFDCERWVPEDEIYYTSDGDPICQECYDEGYFTCEECGEIHSMDDMIAVNRNYSDETYVCEDCADRNYYRCDDCGEWVSSRHVYYDSNLTICDECADDYVTCYDCGDVVHMDNAYYDENSEEYYCDDCAEEHRRRSHIHNYGYKPEPEFHLGEGEDRASTLTFGVELEVDDGDDAEDLAEELDNLYEPIYMKHDGSLDEGVEIVTHPCSLAYHENVLAWGQIAHECREQGFKSHDTDTCGLHIHVGRYQMGHDFDSRAVTAGNLVILANVLWDYLVPFTRRATSKLERWAALNPIPAKCDLLAMSDQEITEAALGTSRCGRYQAVNLSPRDTVEFRIFRGTLKVTTLLASLQLVSNLTKYAMTHTPTECLNATWEDVLSIEEHKELRSYCASLDSKPA